MQRGIDALKGAKSGRIHTFLATSPLHMKMKLRMTPDQVFEQAKLAVRYAKNACPDVEFSPEDASRSEPDFLCRVLEAAIKEGATTINIPDTVGYAVPEQFGELIKKLRERIPEFRQSGLERALPQRPRHGGGEFARRGAHRRRAPDRMHDERPGRARRQHLVGGGGHGLAPGRISSSWRPGIDTTQIVPASRLVSQITGFVVQPNKAVVGANAFAHASGIHQDGVLKARETYEIMTAEDVGWSANKIVLGKLSGRTAFRQRLKELGIELDNEEGYNKAFQRFKDLADKKAEIFDEDLQALVSQEAGVSSDQVWGLVSMSQGSGTADKPHASVVLTNKNKKINAEAKGDGPVDATFKAIESVAKSGAELLLFSVNAVTQGTESQGEVTVRLSKGGRIVNGVGADTDIVVASAKAYVSALNKLESKIERVNPQYQARH